MADRFVAADASPLIGLATAGAFHLLKDLFGRVTVTPAVRDEVLAGGSLPGAPELAEAIASGWIELAETHGDVPALADLDAGEASTLALAVESPDEWLVLIDEPLGRARARWSAACRHTRRLHTQHTASLRASGIEQLQAVHGSHPGCARTGRRSAADMTTDSYVM